MLYREIIAVCSQIHTKHINTLCGQNVELYIKIQTVPRRKHFSSALRMTQPSVRRVPGLSQGQNSRSVVLITHLVSLHGLTVPLVCTLYRVSK